jgi:hypothetical protein
MSHEEDSELPGCSVVAFSALIGAALIPILQRFVDSGSIEEK